MIGYIGVVHFVSLLMYLFCSCKQGRLVSRVTHCYKNEAHTYGNGLCE